MKKLISILFFAVVCWAVNAQTYCLKFDNPISEAGQFRFNYTFTAVDASNQPLPVDASILVNDANNNLIDIIPPAPGGLASYTGSILSPTNTIITEDLGVLSASTGAPLSFSCPILPIELLTFQAQNTEGGNLLTWQTASEVNTSHFDIEASSDPSKGGEWRKLGEVKTQNKAANYTFLDDTPLWGAGGLYYRLKINDLDGKIEYSKVVSLSAKVKDLTARAYPNPTDGVLNIQIEVERKSDLLIELTDILGRKVWSSKAQDTEGGLSLPISMTDWANGTYFLKVSNGQTSTQQKVVKN